MPWATNWKWPAYKPAFHEEYKWYNPSRIFWPDLYRYWVQCSKPPWCLLFYFTYMEMNREGSKDIIIYAHQLQLCVIRYRIDVCLFNGYQVELHFSETKKLKISFRESFNCLIVLKWNKILSFAMYVMISDLNYLIAVWRERFDSKLQHVMVSKTMIYEVHVLFLDIGVKIYKNFTWWITKNLVLYVSISFLQTCCNRNLPRGN